MRDHEFYSVILGLAEPWIVEEVDVDDAGKEVVVHIGRPADAPLACPECGRACPGYDSQPRTWRHLDTCQFHTILVANVPRCRRPEHGVKPVRVPWAEQGSRFSLLFERLAIDWMKELGRTAAAMHKTAAELAAAQCGLKKRFAYTRTTADSLTYRTGDCCDSHAVTPANKQAASASSRKNGMPTIQPHGGREVFDSAACSMSGSQSWSRRFRRHL